MPVPPDGSYQAAAGLGCPAGFDADGALIVEKQLINVFPLIGVIRTTCWHIVLFGLDDLREEWNAHGVTRQPHKIISGSIVQAVFQAVGIGVKCLIEMQPAGLDVHYRNKIWHRTCHCVCDSDGGIVARGKHHAVEQILESEPVARNQVSAASIILDDLIHRVLAIGTGCSASFSSRIEPLSASMRMASLAKIWPGAPRGVKTALRAGLGAAVIVKGASGGPLRLGWPNPNTFAPSGVKSHTGMLITMRIATTSRIIASVLRWFIERFFVLIKKVSFQSVFLDQS